MEALSLRAGIEPGGVSRGCSEGSAEPVRREKFGCQRRHGRCRREQLLGSRSHRRDAEDDVPGGDMLAVSEPTGRGPLGGWRRSSLVGSLPVSILQTKGPSILRAVPRFVLVLRLGLPSSHLNYISCWLCAANCSFNPRGSADACPFALWSSTSGLQRSLRLRQEQIRLCQIDPPKRRSVHPTGLNCRGCRLGPGSVLFGGRYVALALSLRRFHPPVQRCPRLMARASLRYARFLFRTGMGMR